MSNLQNAFFTNDSDVASSSDGWIIASSKVNTRSGKDKILASGAENAIICDNSTLETGSGDDTIAGTGSGYGLVNRQGGMISTGAGDDSIRGEATTTLDGIRNFGDSTIDTGPGNDSIVGIGSDSGDGIYNGGYGGTITTDSGNDQIIGHGGIWGILNYFDGQILTGNGNDKITGSSTRYDGIVNGPDCEIITDNGDDVIIGRGGGLSHDIWNEGLISTGPGDDVVDALPLGFAGAGTVDLGNGRDQLKGFGTGTFLGGKGIDVLTFNPGTYSIASLGDGSYLIGDIMTVNGFERFGPGADAVDFLAAASSGSVTFA
jgi:hypothetical protein